MSPISLIPALYLVFFAALHSLLASLRAKQIGRRILGERIDPLYMGAFVAVAALSLLPLAYLLYIYPGRFLYIVPSPWRWLMVGLQLSAGLYSMKAFTDAPHRFKVQLQLKAPRAPGAEPLAARGIYCRIRDPFLLSGLIIIWLTPFMTVNLAVVYLLASIYLYLGSVHWEKRLLAQFGEEYRSYQKQVPRINPFRGRCWTGEDRTY